METGFKVQMLGAFVVEYGDKTVVPKESRDSKILQLFAYLLCNRDRLYRMVSWRRRLSMKKIKKPDWDSEKPSLPPAQVVGFGGHGAAVHPLAERWIWPRSGDSRLDG